MEAAERADGEVAASQEIATLARAFADSAKQAADVATAVAQGAAVVPGTNGLATDVGTSALDGEETWV